MWVCGSNSWGCAHYDRHFSDTLLCHNDGWRWPGAEWVPGHLQPSCWPCCDECNMNYIIQHTDQIIIIDQIKFKKKQHISFFVIGNRNWPWCIGGWSGRWWYNQSTRVLGHCVAVCPNITYKQRVLMHGHQGWNVRHGLCHIYMRYVYTYELLIAFVSFVVCSLL